MQSSLRRRPFNDDSTRLLDNDDDESHHQRQQQRQVANPNTTKPTPVMSNQPMSTATAAAATTTIAQPTPTQRPKITTTATATTTLTNRSLPTAKQRRLSESSADEYQQYKKNAPTGGNTLLLKNGNLKANDASRRNVMRTPSEETPEEHGRRRRISISNLVDVAIRVVIVIGFICLEVTQAFSRKIHMEELWMYKNPRTPDIVSPQALIIAVIVGPFIVTVAHRLLTADKRDFRAASWTWTLILCLNGLCTSLLKITVGRPRPDFFYRCFPDGVMVLNNFTDSTNHGDFDIFNCTGSAHVINEGRKSFPSGHSSFAFASFGFISFYIGSKLHAFNPHGRAQTWRLCISIAPLIVAAMVAVSRYCDYHHHWQDVVVGSVIGLVISYFVYRQYYPSIFSSYCHRPYSRRSSQTDEVRRRPNGFHSTYQHVTAAQDDDDEALGQPSKRDLVQNDEIRPLIGGSGKPSNKWI